MSLIVQGWVNNMDNRAKGEIHHFANGVMDPRGAAVVGAFYGAFAHGDMGAHVGAAVLVTSFGAAVMGGVVSECTKKHKDVIPERNQSDLKVQGLFLIFTVAALAGVVGTLDYQEGQYLRLQKHIQEAQGQKQVSNIAPKSL